MPYGAIILVVIFVVRSLANRGKPPQARTTTFSQGAPVDGRTLLWVLQLLVWWVAAPALLLEFVLEPTSVLGILALVAVGAGNVWVFVPWWPLRAIARLGKPKLSYWLGQLSLVFAWWTRETQAGSCLLAALALAHRGRVTQAEVDWIQTRLIRAKLHFGTFGCALAVLEQLTSRIARDEGRKRDAAMHAQRARILLGTLTYCSDRGVPRGVRSVVYELLGLDDAAQGNWGALELAPERSLTTPLRALRGAVREKLLQLPVTRRQRWARMRLGSPVLREFLQRPPAETKTLQSVAELWAFVQPTYAKVLRAEPTGVVERLQLVSALDIVLSPAEGNTLLPATLAADEAQHARACDAIVAGLVEPLAQTGLPFHALGGVGPISARLHGMLEARLFGELERNVERMKSRLELGLRYADARDEWLEASGLRGLFRRIEYSLGEPAARQVWPSYAFVYTNYGVSVSERLPRNRPLGHAVFSALAKDAARFEDVDRLALNEQNARVTRGLR